MDLEKEIIEKANLLCEAAFMDFPEYDKENPITTLSEALTAIIWDSLQLERDSSEVYDFINEKLNNNI